MHGCFTYHGSRHEGARLFTDKSSMIPIITISGDIGGGKSAVAKSLSARLGFTVVGTGSIQREIAKKRGVTTLELNRISIEDPSVDAEIDNFVIDLGKTRSDLIVDSRLAWHFIPDSFKVFLVVDPLVGARRVFGDQRAEEENPTLEKTLENNRQRQSLEKARFKHLYQVDFRDFGNYDAVVDTSYSSPEAIADKLAELYRQALDGTPYPRFWAHPRRLLPSRDVGGYSSGELAEMRTSVRREGIHYGQPVELLCRDEAFVILDGHKRALAGQWENLALIPCAVLEYAAGGDGAPEPSWLSAWERALAAAPEA